MEVSKLLFTTDCTPPVESFEADSSGRHSDPSNALFLTSPDPFTEIQSRQILVSATFANRDTNKSTL
jgi:hypothetical protein